MAKNEALYTAICKGKKKDVEVLVPAALANGETALALLMESMIPAMRDIGDRFSRNEVYVPEMLIAARAMQAGLLIVEPILTKGGHQPVAKVCIGTVKGDLHDIGKNLVTMMLKGAGFQVNDLGVDCDAEKFKAAVADGAQVVLLSALLTTTMPYMRTIVEGLAGTSAKIVVGGAPVTAEFAREIGAHGYGSDANDAVRAVEVVLGIKAA